jgi:membrane protein DedA with SNARE-associated domain/membrane-associated phospholipid phosphatase
VIAVVAGLLDRVADLASPWGYVIVGVLALLEASAMIGLFVPGEAALLVGGFLASQQRADLRIMIAVAAVGAIVGDSVGYEIGKHLGPSLRRSRLGRWVGDERWKRAEDYLARHGGRAVFFGRFVGVLRAMVPTIAGLSRMPYRQFLPWNAIGGLIWAPGFVLLGYVAGGSYEQVAHWAGRASTVLLILVVLVVVVVLTARAVVRREGAVRTWFRTQAERPGVARILGRFERQLAYLGRRFRPNAAFGLSLTAGLAGVALVGWAFGLVVQDVISRKDLAGLDGTAYRFFLDHRAPDLTSASRVVDNLGGPVELSLLTMLLAALVWWRTRRPRDLVLPLVAAAGSWLLVEVIKIAVHRTPPPVADMLVDGPGLAFPSGQATRSAACLLTLAYVASGVLPSWRSKVVAATAALSLVILVGLSRLTLAVHWLTDVLGGWALGVLWFGVVVVISEVAASLRDRPAAEPPPEPVAQNRR